MRPALLPIFEPEVLAAITARGQCPNQTTGIREVDVDGIAVISWAGSINEIHRLAQVVDVIEPCSSYMLTEAATGDGDLTDYCLSMSGCDEAEAERGTRRFVELAGPGSAVEVWLDGVEFQLAASGHWSRGRPS